MDKRALLSTHSACRRQPQSKSLVLAQIRRPERSFCHSANSANPPNHPRHYESCRSRFVPASSRHSSPTARHRHAPFCFPFLRPTRLFCFTNVATRAAGVLPMDRLQSEIDQIKASLSPGAPLKSIAYDEGTVSLVVQKGNDHPAVVRVNVVLVSPDAYPISPALLTCEDDAKTSEALLAVTTDFEDSAPLAKVLIRVFECLGLKNLSLPLAVRERNGSKRHFESSASDGNGSDELMDTGNSEFGDENDEEEEEDSFGEAGSYGDDCDAFDSDDDMGLDAEDKDLTVELGQRQGRWEKFEELRRKREEEEGGMQGRSASEKVAENRQIFDTRAAYKMLSKELLDLLREQSLDLLVDAVEDDVYRWCVELTGFDPQSGIGQDISELQRRYSYSTVQIHLSFHRGLHPFYPPRVEILRPRFIGPVAWAVASHPMLHLSNWDPWMRQKELICHIKSFLEKHARIDIDSPMNSILDYPDAAYSHAERQLARLEALSELPPRCINDPQHHELYNSRDVVVDQDRMDALQQPESKRRKSRDDNKGKETSGYWAAGTGYGRGSLEGEAWDAKKAEAAQKAHDAEMERLLSDLGVSLASELGQLGKDDNNEGVEQEVVRSTAQSTGQGPSTSAREASGGGGGVGGIEQVRALVRTMDGSCMVPFVKRQLGGASFTDMCGRAGYYLSIIKVIRELCRPLASEMLFGPAEAGTSSVFDALCLLKEQAHYYSKVIESGREETAKELAKRGQSGQPLSSVSSGAYTEKRAAIENEEKMGLELANIILEVVGELEVLKSPQENGEGGELTSNGTAVVDDTYVEVMKKFQVDFVDGFEDGHHFGSDAQRETTFPKERMVRLGRELAGLQSLLPVTPSSSVFVRVDEQRLTQWRVMITGPEDTPYSCGCFLFDLYFPTSYPQASPKVIFKTTGGGKVRFNPNLYKCGKVCLSLLGTWSGGAGETWDPNASTAFQVLVSIQSLILVPQPYFNEPGFEELMHTEQGRTASKRYSQDIREHTIHRGMIDYLRKVPPEFETPITSHFKLRKDYIMNMCRNWLAEAEDGRSSSHYSRLKALVDELQGLLNNL